VEFDRLRDTLKQHAIATERYTSKYAAFAMEPEGFSSVLTAVDKAEQSGAIFVEVANDQDS
jgi:hypothetical protein